MWEDKKSDDEKEKSDRETEVLDPAMWEDLLAQGEAAFQAGLEDLAWCADQRDDEKSIHMTDAARGLHYIDGEDDTNGRLDFRAKEKKIARLEQELSAAQQQVKDKDREIDYWKKELRNKRQGVNYWKKEPRNKKQGVNYWKKELRNKEQEIDDLKEQIRELQPPPPLPCTVL